MWIQSARGSQCNSGGCEVPLNKSEEAVANQREFVWWFPRIGFPMTIYIIFAQFCRGNFQKLIGVVLRSNDGDAKR